MASSILRRLRGLLARTRSPNPHEAATARALADELMARHGVREADVAPPEDTTVVVSAPGYAKEQVVSAIAASRGCMASRSRVRGCVDVKGARHAVDDAVSVYHAFVAVAESSRLPGLVIHVGGPAGDAYSAVFWSMFVDYVMARFVPPAPPPDDAPASFGTQEAPPPGEMQAPPSAHSEEVERIGRLFDRLAEWVAMMHRQLDPQDVVQRVYMMACEGGNESAARAAKSVRVRYEPPPPPPEPPVIPRGALPPKRRWGKSRGKERPMTEKSP